MDQAETYAVESTSHKMRHHNGQVVGGHTQLEGVRARMQHHGFLSPLAHTYGIATTHTHTHTTTRVTRCHYSMRAPENVEGGVGASSTGGSSKDGDR